MKMHGPDNTIEILKECGADGWVKKYQEELVRMYEPGAVMKCPKCQVENREWAEFCGECGHPLQTELMCPQCGNTNPQGKKFCDRCGHILAEPTPPPPPMATAQTHSMLPQPNSNIITGNRVHDLTTSGTIHIPDLPPPKAILAFILPLA